MKMAYIALTTCYLNLQDIPCVTSKIVYILLFLIKSVTNQDTHNANTTLLTAYNMTLWNTRLCHNNPVALHRFLDICKIPLNDKE